MSSASNEASARSPRAMDELWRFVLGGELRRMRNARRERLEDTAARAGISPQYLSEMERGRKDASSEMIAAVIGALDSSLADVLLRVASELDARPAAVVDIRSATGVTRQGAARTSGPVLFVAA